MLAVVIVVLLAIILPPLINVNRYRNRVTAAISQAVGRPVTVSHISLELLPAPGLVLSDFVVFDDPSFSAEPMLHADSVNASLRLTSLWRGRLEIGSLDLDNASLNLVRRDDGHWNLEDLVERTAQTPSAPTTKTRPETRPRFPYIEASNGRINFKFGQVKKAFSFTDADFALWLESENQWAVRLKAQPVRTDLNINDSGTFSMDGQFQRASSLRTTPITFHFTYRQGQLGQITKIIYGHDRGWRGNTLVTATLTGTPEHISGTVDAQIDDFRRYDIVMGESIRLRTHCTGTFSSADQWLRDLHCQSPVGSGLLQVSGQLQGPSAASYEFDIAGQQIPLARLIAIARHAKKDLPADLTATGQTDLAFSVRRSNGDTPVWSGGGKTSQFVLQSSALKQPLPIGEVEYGVPSSPPKPHLSPALLKSHAAVQNSGAKHGADMFSLLVKPFPLPLGALSPATASAMFDRERYSFNLDGDAEMERLLNVAQALGIGVPGVGIAGPAQVDLSVAGTWLGFSMPVPSGQIQLHNATAELQGITEPLQVSSAKATLGNQVVNVSSLAAGFTKGPELSGSASFPVHCTAPETCVVHFDLKSGDLSLERLQALVSSSANQPWYRLLAIGQRHEAALLKLRATGHVALARFTLGTLPATNVTGNLSIDGGKLQLENLSASMLGGHCAGTWAADFTESPPRFEGTGAVSKLAMAQLATVMRDNWATGTLDAQYTLSMRGVSASALESSAHGSSDFKWSGGSLRHVALEGHGSPVTFSLLSGTLTLQDKIFRLSDSKMQSSGNVFNINGTAAYDRTIDIRLEHAGARGHSYNITGSLDNPQVKQVFAPAAEAELRFH